MNRKNFLRTAGLLGIGSILPLNLTKAAISRLAKADLAGGGGCVLIPSETRGPYPLDLSGNSSMFRQSVNETKTGLPLGLTLTIVNVNDNCAPIPNVRVDIWHCDKDGVYSGFNQPGANTVGQTFCRGIQMTDSNGQVRFTTVYPGWYNGRTTHIHFEMYLSSVLSATSQLAFPDGINAEVYNTPLYSGRGQNTSVTTNIADNVFSDGVQYQLAAVVANAATGGYDSSLTVGIAAPKSGVINLEPETGGQFTLGKNYPNPFRGSTTIPFSLSGASRVKIDLYDMAGQKVLEIMNRNLDPGQHTVLVKRTMNGLKLQSGNYVYQITTENSSGVFSQCKVLTVE